MSNIQLNAPTSSGATLGTDKVAGVDYQIVKVSFSTAGNPPVQVDASNGLPVLLTGASAVTATQSGTWTVQPGNTANTTPWLITLNQGGNSATVTAANALKVDGSAVTQPVSGTFWQATQPISGGVNATQAGTWTVQPGNTANTTPWLISGAVSVSNLPATQAISAASLPLPANAAQETGGNLVLLTRLLDLDTQILATLRAIQLQHAAFYTRIAGVQIHVDPADVLSDALN